MVRKHTKHTKHKVTKVTHSEPDKTDAYVVGGVGALFTTGLAGSVFGAITVDSARAVGQKVKDLAKAVKAGKEEAEGIRRELGFRDRDWKALSSLLDEIPHDAYISRVGVSEVEYIDMNSTQRVVVSFEGEIPWQLAEAFTDRLASNLEFVLSGRLAEFTLETDIDREAFKRMVGAELDMSVGREYFQTHIRGAKTAVKARETILSKINTAMTRLASDPIYGEAFQERLVDIHEGDGNEGIDRLVKLVIKQDPHNPGRLIPVNVRVSSNVDGSYEALHEGLQDTLSRARSLRPGERYALLMHNDLSLFEAVHM